MDDPIATLSELITEGTLDAWTVAMDLCEAHGLIFPETSAVPHVIPFNRRLGFSGQYTWRVSRSGVLIRSLSQVGARTTDLALPWRTGMSSRSGRYGHFRSRTHN